MAIMHAHTSGALDPSRTHPPLLTLDAIRKQAQSLGFADVSVAHFDGLPPAAERLTDWLSQGMHGHMAYLDRHAHIRANPSALLPQARCALLLRMDYLPQAQQQLAHSVAQRHAAQHAQVSVYAQGRDYHAVLRARLKHLVGWLQAQTASHAPPEQFRVFTDSAPVMEVELAQASGLGWRGKHTLLLNREAGSMFFLGGILTTLDLPATPSAHASQGNCGQCRACLDVCPTQAIVAPYVVDARRCISYLTIEHEGAIDAALRPLMGNKIYGCDDCQTACPWNKFAQPATVDDFAVRYGLDNATLLALWSWSEAEFLRRTEGSAIRRIGHARWLRNIATALGNSLNHALNPVPVTPLSHCEAISGDAALHRANIRSALMLHANHPDAAVREHVAWALAH